MVRVVDRKRSPGVAWLLPATMLAAVGLGFVYYA
jgi:hypothetical protein